MKASRRCVICEGDSVKMRYAPLAIVECDSCGLTYRDVVALDSGYYANLQKYQQLILDPVKMEGRKRDAKLRFDILASVIPSKGNLLDIGANEGLSLQEARKRGFTALGCEPNTFAAEYAKTSGLEIIQKPFEDAFDLIREKGPFSVVMLFHVLEHFPDPLRILHMLAQILAQDAWLVIEVPDIESPISWIFRWEDMRINKEHLFYFNKRTLHLLLKKAGFSPLVSKRRVWDGLNRPLSENLIRLKGLSETYAFLRIIKRGAKRVLGIKAKPRQNWDDNLELWSGKTGTEKKYFLSGFFGRLTYHLGRGDDLLVLSKIHEE